MQATQVLYPTSERYQTLEIAPPGFGYLFHVTRQDGRNVDFVLQDWAASDSTARYMERQGYTVQVIALAYDPDEDFLNDVLLA